MHLVWFLNVLTWIRLALTGIANALWPLHITKVTDAYLSTMYFPRKRSMEMHVVNNQELLSTGPRARDPSMSSSHSMLWKERKKSTWENILIFNQIVGVNDIWVAPGKVYYWLFNKKWAWDQKQQQGICKQTHKTNTVLTLSLHVCRDTRLVY